MSCPRCNSGETRVMAKAPLGDAWEVYVCSVCSYSWRSTEQVRLDEKFKLNPADINALGVIPPIPKLLSPDQ